MTSERSYAKYITVAGYLSLKTERKLNLASCLCEVLLRPKNPIHLTLHLTVLFTAHKQEDLLERLRMSHSSFRHSQVR